MPQVVQARCPHCQKALRIPAEWLARSMRCKFCKQIFQGQQPAGVEAALTAAPAARPVPASHPHGGDPFGFDDGEEALAAPSRRSRRPKGNKALLMLAIFAVLTLVGGTTAALLYKNLAGNKNSDEQRAEAKDPGESTTKTTKHSVPSTSKTGTSSNTGKGTSGSNPPKGPTTDKGNSNTKVPPKRPTPVKGGPEVFPRRALLISVNNYLMFNRVEYGNRDNKFSGSTAVLRERFQGAPMNIHRDQIIELSDEAKPAHPTQKAVIETTITDFLESCRPQDRIILLFAGHACDIEKNSYLIPIEGTRDEPEKLIKLQWVYDQLAKCKARQKVFILDAFRYAPARGFELPGAGEGERGEMGEVFDQNLQKPPPGVQVWSACIKGQASIELDSGSAFLQALLKAMSDRNISGGIGVGGDPLPIDDLVVKTNKQLQLLVKPEKQEQMSRLVGKEAEGGAPYNPEEPLPVQLAIKPPPVPAGGLASNAQMEKLLEGLRELPAVRETRSGELNLLRAGNLPPMPAKAVEEFKGEDFKSVADLKTQFNKDPDEFAKKFPVRAGYFEAVKALEESHRIQLLERVNGPSPLDGKVKARFLQVQEEPARLIFLMEGALARMKEVEDEERDKEKSKLWLANFDYAKIRLESRLLYLHEYNYLIAGIRADRLPDLEPGQSGWRVGTVKKIKSNEAKAKALFKDIPKHWQKLEKQYADTPWAVLARRESLVALGLEWRAKSD